VQIQPVTAEVADAIGLKEAKGALIAEAQPNGPAAKAGLKRGDTILAVNGEKIADARALSRKIATFAPGTKASLTIWRDGKEREVAFEVGRQPAA
jgi:serine protease Do